jgi:methylglutaconyl-CoA hydratase
MCPTRTLSHSAFQPPDSCNVSRLRVAVSGAVGRVTLSHPRTDNAIDGETARQLTDVLIEFEGDDEVRCVLLNADGPNFCGGADLESLATLLDGGPELFDREAEDLGRLFLSIRGMQKPVIAAVQGKALGVGCGLATACDVVLARDDARLGYTEVRLGLVPAMLIPTLRRTVNEKQAFDLIASGRIVNAPDAERIGLVSRVVPFIVFDDEVERYVLSIAASPSVAMGITKRLFYRVDNLGFRDSIATSVAGNLEARETEDFRTAVLRYVKRAD